MRTAVYARFSSELQDARSIEDQFAAAREYARRQGFVILAEYADAAISGAALSNRPGLLDLLQAAKERRFDAVLTESLDRLSRSLADIARLYEDLNYLGMQLWTLTDGRIGTMHIGMKGTIAKMYLEDLAHKTRRGQVGRVKAGRIPGGRCYGYDAVAGDQDRGRRTINESSGVSSPNMARAHLLSRSLLG